MQIHTGNDAAAIEELASAFGIEAGVHEDAFTFLVASGEQFVPQLDRRHLLGGATLATFQGCRWASSRSWASA